MVLTRAHAHKLPTFTLYQQLTYSTYHSYYYTTITIAARSQLLTTRHHLVTVKCYNSQHIAAVLSLCSAGDIELPHRQSARSTIINGQFLLPAQNISVFLIRPCVFSTPEILFPMQYINRHFTYLLTYYCYYNYYYYLEFFPMLTSNTSSDFSL